MKLISKYALGFAAGLLLSLSALGASPDAKLPANIEKTLQGIPQGGKSCTAQGAPPSPTQGRETTQVTAAPRRDRSCLLAVSPAKAELPGRWQLVDSRPASEFQKFQVNGALNLQADLIKSKSYLSRQPILLMGDGKSDQYLVEACADLKQRGFQQVRVLAGGMLAWTRAKLPLIGVVPDIFTLAQLTPAELYREMGLPGNLVIDAFPGGELVLPEQNSDVANWLARIKDRAAKYKKRGTLDKIIIVAGERLDKTLYEELSAVLPNDLLLVYTESREAYDKFEQTQKDLLARHARGPRSSKCSAM